MASDIQMEVDFREFGSQIQRLAFASRRTCREVVEQQSRLIVVDCIKSTPPTGNRPLREGWSFQKRKGEQTIDRDFNRLFQPLASIKAVMYPTGMGDRERNVRRMYLKQMAERGDWHSLSEALFAMKVTDQRVPIQETLTMEQYKQFRGKPKGQVPPRRERRQLVWESSALQKVRSELKSRVGWAKAGWMAAANKLGVKRLPKWISDHPAPGGFLDETRDPDSPAFTIINSVSYISYLNNGNRLLLRVLRNRERAMDISIEHALDHFIEEFNKA